MSNNPVVCGFHETEVIVNAQDCEAHMRYASTLHFSLYNSGAKAVRAFSAGAAKPMIQVMADVGSGSHNLFTQHDASGYGNITSPGFKSSGWQTHPIFRNRIYCNLTPEAKQSVDTLEPLNSFYFTWSGITSTSCEGFCTILLNIQEVAGIKKLSPTFSLMKRRADPRVMQFEASPSTAGIGDAVTLNWRVVNAQAGYLLPGNYNIFEKGYESVSSKEVVLQDDLDGYYLNISNGNYSCFQRVNLFIAPPAISSLSVDNKTAHWEAHFVPKVRFEVDEVFQDKDPASQAELPTNANQVGVFCKNSEGQIGLQIPAKNVPGLDVFQLESFVYKAHKILRLTWKTSGFQSVDVGVSFTRYDTVSQELSGQWEQAYSRPANCSFFLNYVTAEGNEGQVRIKSVQDKEVESDWSLFF